MTELCFDDETLRSLRTHGFDLETFIALQKRLKSGRAGGADNRIRGRVSPPTPGEIAKLPPRGSGERDALERRGREAIAAGEVGAVILAGGMATRFGGVVKAGVEAVDGHTFLDLKLRDVAVAAERAGDSARVPVYLMTSFATDEVIRELAEPRSTDSVPIETFEQLVSVRLTPDGEIFYESDGRPSLYAPGHGDLTFALRASGALGRFRAAGGELLLMSNVDNLGATLDPAIVGAHLASGCQVTVECAAKEPGDKGGAPARVDADSERSTLQIVEAFRFPEGFDQDSISVFNTNTLVLDAAAIDRDFDLTWFAVEKKVEGRAAIQFEHLVGELTAFLPSSFLEVPRTGPDGRFLPAKDPDELARRVDDIREALTARGALP